MKIYHFAILLVITISCSQPNGDSNEVELLPSKTSEYPSPEYSLSKDQTHNKFSNSIPPVLHVNSGAVIEAYTEEATDGQLTLDSDTAALMNISFDPIHPLTGPVFVEEAEPGDVLAVKLHKIEIGNWGWTAILPGFGFLADEFTTPHIKTFSLDSNDTHVQFSENIQIPVKPFAGVLGVAPPTDSLLSTIPPRANGGNMDDPNIIEGTTVYLPVFVKGALFSIGDAHVTQGMGEVCGTAVEAPMRFIYELSVIKNQTRVKEPQYETDTYYAVTAYGTSIDIATKKAVQYMIDYLVEQHGLTRNDAYMLCSLAGDLKIAEVVDVPHMLVTMHMPKNIFNDK